MTAELCPPVLVGTDCSGMETPLMALSRLEVPYKHVFSCDVDRHVRKHIAGNFSPAQCFPDLMTRDNSSPTTPSVQLYIAGFPCQPFSSAGLQKGFKDKRGIVFYGCARYIDSKRPWIFILENVRKLINHDGGKTFKKVMQTLYGIGNGVYSVDWKLLDTQDHGVPQSRQRVYIVGILKDRQRSEIRFPETIPRVSIETFLDPVDIAPTMEDLPSELSKTAHRNVKRTMEDLAARGERPLLKTFVIDHGSSAKRCSVVEDKVMCMTKSRAAGHWVTSRGRQMNLDEMLRCQGMERCFKQVTTNRQLGIMIGNAMSQNVLERLLIKVLPAAGLALGRPLVDRWAAGKVELAAQTMKRQKKSTDPRPEVL
jgi:DNA (cytosine-5)-methyltransferase 1